MSKAGAMAGVLRRALAGAWVILVLAGPAAAQGAIEINTATRAELERLNGIGVALAERILAERERRAFADWSDLERRVKGLRGVRAQRLREQGATVNGRGDSGDRRPERKP